MHSLYWFDFETFGINPARDRPSQFAGIRTNMDFEVIDEPLNLFCKPADDFIPHPEACLVTGITPQLALKKGIAEKDFFRQIYLELSTANTCAVGYNNIRFDDEVVRFGLYRNFYDAYSREWQNGNSRWDILDMLRMTYALRPQGINWPINEKGRPDFRLEKLTIANGVEHANAHDALADVYATINMARLVKQHQPRLFQYLFELRDKNHVMTEIDLISFTPFIHCSGMLDPQHGYCAVMLPLAAHPHNKNSVICLDLTKPQVDITQLDIDTIKSRIFTRNSDLPIDTLRIPVKEIHYNKCPAVAPISVLNEATQDRLNINLHECLKKAKKIKLQINDIRKKLISIYQQQNFEPINNPDYALYSGGFFNPSDKNKMQQIRQSHWDTLANSQFEFDDKRLKEMLFRYRARNAPESLTLMEKEKWKTLKNSYYYDKHSGSTLLYSDFLDKLHVLKQNNSDSKVLDDLECYVKQLIHSLAT